MRLLKHRNGSVLLEGLITLTVINIMIILIFAYIRSINDSYTNKIHKERATLLLIEAFERIRSARDTAVNINIKDGWNDFIAPINEESEENFLSLKKSGQSSDDVAEGQWLLEKKAGPTGQIFSYNIAPYADYITYINAKFGEGNEDESANKDEAIFNVTVRWRDIEDVEAVDFYGVSQQMILTNYQIYENLY